MIMINDSESRPTKLRYQICSIFSDAQKTTVGHRKHIASLRKLQENGCSLADKLAGEARSSDGYDEKTFNSEFERCTLRILGVKKAEVAGDRLVRFISLFLRLASEKDLASMSVDGKDDVFDKLDFPTARLAGSLLQLLSNLMGSKEKTIRYRAAQLVAHIINSITSIDDDLYRSLKTILLRRIMDKEPSVRVQAVTALGILAANENEEPRCEDPHDSEDGGENDILQKLFSALENDPSAEVRRSLLLNLPLTPNTLAHLLERARDVDAVTRKALYSRLLPALGDFRHLSLSMREKLLRWGLRDRDESVRKSTGRLFAERWIEDCAGAGDKDRGKPYGDLKSPSSDALLELLERIDVVNSGVDAGIAGEAMKEFWTRRPDYFDAAEFDESFWANLTPESAFTARSFNDIYCQKVEGINFTAAEEKIPEVTKLAFVLERYVKILVERLDEESNTAPQLDHEEIEEKEFIVEQILEIAKTLDYRDEVGRRKMFTLLREILAIPEMPEEVTRLTVDVLKIICGDEPKDEGEFCSVILEAIAEVHDAIISENRSETEPDESFHSAHSAVSDTPPNGYPKAVTKLSDEEVTANAVKEIMINMKCLHIAQCMLQNIEGDLQRNVHLVTMLNNLIVPAVRSHEAPIREKGLLCLGLCCLLDKNLADENFTLFLHCFNKGHSSLQVSAVHVLADILETHPSLMTTSDHQSLVKKSIHKILAKGMRAYDCPELQSATVTAFCKLALASVLTDEDLLKQAVILFFDPESRENAGVRQALSYFIPVYCHSKQANMVTMIKSAGSVLVAAMDLVEDADRANEGVRASTISNMLLDWTDGRKLVAVPGYVTDQIGLDMGNEVVNPCDCHLLLAETCLTQAMASGSSREHKKALAALASKIHVSTECSVEWIRRLKSIVENFLESKIPIESATKSSVTKLQLALKRNLGGEDQRKAGEGGVLDMTTEAEMLSLATGGATIVDGAQREEEVEESLEALNPYSDSQSRIDDDDLI